MVKVNREIVHSLRNQGKTFADIGRIFDRSLQYIWSLYTGYYDLYRKTEKYKMARRHQKHTNPTKPCSFCPSMSTLSMPSTV